MPTAIGYFFSQVLSTAVILCALTFSTQITFAQTNLPPTADAGPDLQANESAFAVLDGSNSTDPEFLPLTYSWTQIAGPAAILLNPTSSTLSVIVPVVGGAGGTMTFSLTVVDSVGQTSSDSANIVIKSQNFPPVASIVAPTQVSEGALVTLDATGTFDPNNDPIMFGWTQAAGPSVNLDLTDPAKPTFIAPTTGTGSLLRFMLLASDGQASSTAIVDIQVTTVNHAPVADAGTSQTTIFGSTVTLDGTLSSDPDGNPITYTWTQTSGPSVNLNLANPANPTFVAPSTASTLVFSLVVKDQTLSSAPKTVSIYVFSPNAAPNCANARGNKFQLWPPNHTFSRVKIRGISKSTSNHSFHNGGGDDGEGDDDADDSDEDTRSLMVRVTQVTQDEPTTGTGPGDAKPDAIVQSTRPNGRPRRTDLLMIRRERSDSGNGRIYEVTFRATNTISNLSCTGKIQVCVPTKRGPNGKCVNSGQNFNSRN